MALLAPPDHADDYFDVLSLLRADETAAWDLKQQLEQADDKLNQAFYQGHNISRLVSTRAWIVEQFVLYCWRQNLLQQENLSLIAVGGFGRGELHPHSDVDLLILYQQQLPQQQIAGFVQNLWDLGLEVGHSVRNLSQTIELASQDVTVATNLMEARLMSGDAALFSTMMQQTDDRHLWSGPDFFKAKLQEQISRHKKCGGTAYNLEPDIKEGQGGLRDIQMVTWVAQRHFHVSSMHGLVDVGFLQPDEYIRLQKGQRKLWKIRFALHLLSGRKENRLLFEHQKKLAKIFGYVDDENSLAVEKLMQSHYRNAMHLELLNMRLLQLFEENILQKQSDKVIKPLSADFLIVNNYLEATDSKLFINRPQAIMEMFLHYQKHPEILGIRANTLRYLSRSLHIIDDQFRADTEIRQKFLQIFKQPTLVFKQLALMNALGILGLYLPVFGKIVGRMQYDLFHAYTIDQHSLFVLRNIRRMIRDGSQHPKAHQVSRNFQPGYILCLAGFLHDIGKGRGGDHAEIGAIEAAQFAADFALPKADKKLLIWLVKNHLLMSTVAQKQDISDPNVITDFTQVVQSQQQLDALYVLTIADICGTNPKLWNSFKDSLLSELYQRGSQQLQNNQAKQPLEQPLDSRGQDSRRQALKLIDKQQQQAIKKRWQTIPQRFFAHCSARQLAQISLAIEANQGRETVCITAKHHDGFELALYGRDHQGLFHHLIQLFAQYGINIVNARIFSGSNGTVIDTFHCLGDYDQNLLQQISGELLNVLQSQNYQLTQQTISPNARQQLFTQAPQINCSTGNNGKETRLEVKCTDHNGLLLIITACLLKHQLDVHGAKITTFGDRAEDVFWISHHNTAITAEQSQQLTQDLKQQLSIKQ